MSVSRYIDSGWKINLISLLWLFEADDSLTMSGNLQTEAKNMTRGHHDLGHDIDIVDDYFEGNLQLCTGCVLVRYQLTNCTKFASRIQPRCETSSFAVRSMPPESTDPTFTGWWMLDAEL